MAEVIYWIILGIIILWSAYKMDKKDRENREIKIKETNESIKTSTPLINHTINKSVKKNDEANTPQLKTKYDFYFYHFTDPSNIPLIKKYGLLSWQQLLLRNVSHKPASNNLSRDLDRKHNLQDYVRLSLNQSHPMYSAALYYNRVRRLVWLKIIPEVMDLPGTLFSNDNATSNRAVINNAKSTALNSLAPQAEILVKKRIDPKYIIFPY